MIVTTDISPLVFAQLSERISQVLGLYFPPERWRDLERGLIAVARKMGSADLHACIQRLISVPLGTEEIGLLAASLTIGETYFFRDARLFNILRERILPDLRTARCHQHEPSLRLWSAGCSTGEEPYSLAILLHEVFENQPPWKIALHATDINPESIEKAKAGIYGPWSFRDTPSWVKERHFTQMSDRQFLLDQAVRSRVTFSPLNLVSDEYPSPLNDFCEMDLIFCRNVLMYFHPDLIPAILHRLYLMLAPGGWLIVSPSETALLADSEFAVENIAGAFLFRKATGSPVKRTSGLSPMVQPSPDYHREIPPAIVPPVPQPMPQAPVRQAIPEATPIQKAAELYHQAQYASVISCLSALTDPSSDELLLLAKAGANLGRLDEAADWCERATGKNKLHAQAYYLLATIRQEQGKIDEALSALHRVIYLAPDFPLAHFTLGSLLRQVGKRQEAAKYLRTALRLLEKHQPEETLDTWDGMSVGRLNDIIQTMLGREALHGA